MSKSVSGEIVVNAVNVGEETAQVYIGEKIAQVCSHNFKDVNIPKSVFQLTFCKVWLPQVKFLSP